MANLTRFDPFSEMITLRQAMDRLFEDSFVSPMTWRSLEHQPVTAALDVHQTADEIVVTAALPGVKPEDVDITLTGQTLQIRAEAFNVTNSVRFAPPNMVLTNGLFGNITSAYSTTGSATLTGSGGRIVQLALKYVF